MKIHFSLTCFIKKYRPIVSVYRSAYPPRHPGRKNERIFIKFGVNKGYSKVIPVLYNRAIKTYFGSRGIAPRILNLGVRWSELSLSPLGRFTPRERPPPPPGTRHWIGGWAGLRTGLDTVLV
jgi:hypothetical protein